MMNAAIYAMKVLQTSMKDEAEKAGLRSDEDVVALIGEMHSEEQEYRAIVAAQVDCILTGDKKIS